MDDTSIVLHIGAGKCGSSALQTALSAHPDLHSAAGRRFLYVAYRELGGTGRLLYGSAARRACRHSVFGYVCWPNVVAVQRPEQFWQALHRVVDSGRRRNFVPIVSNEGWMGHADRFARNFLTGGDEHPSLRQVSALAFVRPPLDWLNAAYWQWGVWGGVGFDRWLANPAHRFRLGTQLAAWASVPDLRLKVLSASRDVVQGFAETFALPLEGGRVTNTAAPPALTGFLLRNRRYRPTAHESGVEFIFQRWCRIENAGRLWAVRPRHLARIGADMAADVERLLAAIAPGDAAALLEDPRWRSTDPYDEWLHAAPPQLDDPEALAALLRAVTGGVEAAARAARRRLPDLPASPAASAGPEAWDAALGKGFDALIAMDEAARLGRLRLALRQVGGPALRQVGMLSSPGSGATPFAPDATTAPDSSPAFAPDLALAAAGPVLAAIAAPFGSDGGKRFEGKPLFDMPLLVVACTPHSGGAQLCNHLLGTGFVAGGGNPLAPTNIMDARASASPSDPPTDLPTYLAGLVRQAPAGARAFCLLVFWEQLVALYRWNLPAMFGVCHLIHVSRQDGIAQAAGFHVASQLQGLMPLERVAAPPVYDSAVMNAILTRQRRDDAMIGLVATALGQTRILLRYEQIATRPDLPLRRLMTLCGIGPDDWTPPSVQPPPRENPAVAAFAARYRAGLRAAILNPPKG